MPFTILEVAEIWKVRLIPTIQSFLYFDPEAHNVGSYEVLGSPPDPENAWLGRDESGFFIVYRKPYSPCEALLHEVMHLACGTAALKDEGVLMALQWAVIQHLAPEDRTQARHVFSEYYLDWRRNDGIGSVNTEIGRSDDFLDSLAWKELEGQARRIGLLDRHLQPCWGVVLPHDPFCPSPWPRPRQS